MILNFPAVSVAIPPTASVGEEEGTVEVCATLSVSGTTAGAIDIMLATSDGEYNIFNYCTS